MKNLSIVTFVNILFTITFGLFISFYIFYIQIDKQQQQQMQIQRYNLLTSNIVTKLDTIIKVEQLSMFFDKIDLIPILIKNKKLQIFNDGKLIYKYEHKYLRIRVFILEKQSYIYIQKLGLNLMFKDKYIVNNKFFTISLMALLIFLIILTLYFIILKKLKPLKELNNKIKQFSIGDFGVKLNIDSSDEIGQISLNFNKASKNIKYLIDSKNLFMRNIMHELKTPITKALFLIQMIDTKNIDDKNKLKETLYNMNNILQQLANIEKLQIQYANLIKVNINILSIIEDIKLELNTNNIIIEDINNFKLIANKELFYIVLKNLFENGLKYSDNNKVIITYLDSTILIKSKGIKLRQNLDYYIQPFTQEQKNDQGFGLGLYIVSKILKLHNLKFNYKYEYEYEYNVFYIEPNINTF
jgi:two-component system OmpR family sensor kinase